MSAQLPVAVLIHEAYTTLHRAFDERLRAAGGTVPVWHILLAIHDGSSRTQRELARAVRIHESTLTHHLRGMEERGLIVRTRSDENRRVQQIEITDEGVGLFRELKRVAIGYDRRLRGAIGDEAAVADFFEQLRHLAETASRED